MKKRPFFSVWTLTGRIASTNDSAAISPKCCILRVFWSFLAKVGWPVYLSIKNKKNTFFGPALWTVDLHKTLFFPSTTPAQKTLFPSATVVDGRLAQNTLVFNRRSQRGQMSQRNLCFWSCYGRFKLRIFSSFSRSSCGPLWTLWPIRIPQMRNAWTLWLVRFQHVVYTMDHFGRLARSQSHRSSSADA